MLGSGRRGEGARFQGTPSEIPPFSIIYRLVSLGLGADSFIRRRFDLKIHTVIASGVEEVKESACVPIIKKPLPHFFFFRCRREGKR